MSLIGILKKGGKYLNEQRVYNKEVKNAKKLEEDRKYRETELAKLTEDAKKSREKELERIDKFEKLRKSFDGDWEAKLNSSVNDVMGYLNALKGIDDKAGIEYLSNMYHLSEDASTKLYKSLSKGNSIGRLRDLHNKVYKEPYYISRYNHYVSNHEVYNKYKGYVIPNNTARNATKVVTPEAEAINATANTTPEVPKDPSSAGILKNALSKFKKDPSNKGLDPKDPKVIGQTLKIISPGTIVGGASGEFVTDDEAPWQTHLRNILTGAALGTGGKIAYHQLRPIMPSKGKVLKYGAGLGTIGGGLYYKENIKDYANNLWNSTTPKPEDTSPPIGTPLGTPTNTNTNKKRW